MNSPDSEASVFAGVRAIGANTATFTTSKGTVSHTGIHIRSIRLGNS